MRKSVVWLDAEDCALGTRESGLETQVLKDPVWSLSPKGFVIGKDWKGLRAWRSADACITASIPGITKDTSKNTWKVYGMPTIKRNNRYS